MKAFLLLEKLSLDYIIHEIRTSAIIPTAHPILVVVEGREGTNSRPQWIILWVSPKSIEIMNEK